MLLIHRHTERIVVSQKIVISKSNKARGTHFNSHLFHHLLQNTDFNLLTVSLQVIMQLKPTLLMLSIVIFHWVLSVYVYRISLSLGCKYFLCVSASAFLL